MSQIKVELQEHMGNDESIANAAWTSTYDKERREGKYDDPAKVADIVKRCVRDGHSVPLESVVFRFWVRMPIFADRQHMTHRIASHNGLSGRYRTVPSDWYGVPPDVKAIADKAHGPGAGERLSHDYNYVCGSAYEQYGMWLEALRHAEKDKRITNDEYKRAREVLRAAVPTAFMTERTTVMNLVAFANYQRLRNSLHAQPEIRLVAERMLAEVLAANVAPTALTELMAVGWALGKPNFEFHMKERS